MFLKATLYHCHSPLPLKGLIPLNEAKAGPHPTPNWPIHVFVSHSKQKRAIFPKISKVNCDICTINTMVEKGKNSICCKNYDQELFLS